MHVSDLKDFMRVAQGPHFLQRNLRLQSCSTGIYQRAPELPMVSCSFLFFIYYFFFQVTDIEAYLKNFKQHG